MPAKGGSTQPSHSKPLRGLNRAIVALQCLKPFKTSAKQKRDRDVDSQPRPRPRLNSQPQGATKILTQMMADEFNFLWSQILNDIGEADAEIECLSQAN